MTASTMVAADEVGKTMDKEQPISPPNVRKRRRRVPTTGASEDCHTCRKRNVQCDRRRPYCSQCLEVKESCGGYRTTLTWGVGVASRGKLRGMSLPVAKPAGGQEVNKPAAPQTSARPRANTMHTPSSQAVGTNGEDGPRKRMRLNPLQTNVQSLPPNTSSMPSPYYTNGYHGGAAFPTWPQSSYHSHMGSQPQQFGHDGTFPFGGQQRRSELFPLHTTVATTFTGLPWSPDGSVQSGPSPMYFEDMSPFNNFPRQPGLPSVPQTLPSQSLHSSPVQVHQPAKNRSMYQQPPQAPPAINGVHFDGNSRSNSFPESQPFSVLGSNDVPVEKQGNEDSVKPSLKRTLSAPEVAAIDQSESQNESPQDEPPSGTTEALIQNFQPRMHPPNMNVSSRIWSLLEYYDKNICPVLVTFDNEDNPYRKFIMNLALQNEGLQNALAALVTNNMRMRCLKEIPSLSDDGHHESIIKAIGVPSSEERYYKAKSVNYLNSQLTDNSKAADDSVLATLLILCLFHVSDSGFSKFKTQLQGVQVLLGMRAGMPRSDFQAWVEMFFAWFDVMTSAVNDRETKVHGEIIDLMDLSNNLGSVEEFSGCDGRLFKLIARLGRLNLLSQRRQPKESSSPIAKQHRRVDSALDFFSLPTEQLDVPSDWDEFISPQDDLKFDASAPPPDDRAQFWLEWQELQDLFHSWQNTRFNGLSLDSPNLSDGQKAMLHMSESFRWAALVYLERLADPSLASSSSTIQDLVKKSLHHIDEIGTNSCVTKFMLWPLFISGTECVEEKQRGLIRERCIEIQQESGFYNNISGLEVLERVWRKNGVKSGERHLARGQCSQQAFHWRSCMDRVDGEYIVI
ncbi:MAG: hypothetical protein Q9159_006582 [Coniocarpon cinnabarinum]